MMLGLTAANAQAPAFTWVAGVGTTALGQVGTVDRHDCDVTTIATTGAGQTYVTGSFKRSVEFGTTNLVSAGDQDIFLAKLDPNGNYLWAQGMGGTDNDVASELAVDDDGSAYVIGSYQDYGIGATFGTIIMPNLGRRFGQCFVAKLNSTGSFDWVTTTSSGTYDEFGQSLALDHRGGVYTAGFYSGPSIGFGATTLTGNPGAHTGFLAKIGDSPLARVVSLMPAQGSAGTTVTVRGARLSGATAVYFNGVPATSFVVTSPTTLTAVAPAGVSTGPVSVQTPAGAGPAGLVFQVGTFTSSAGARPAASGFWPNPVAVGGRVRLGGVGTGAPHLPAQAALYTLLGQRVLARAVPPTGEVELGVVPSGSYVLVVSTPGLGVARYPLRVE